VTRFIAHICQLTGLTIVFFQTASVAFAQETCGLLLAKFDQPDPVFRNGFENILALKAAPSESRVSVAERAKGTGLGPALTTVMPPALGITPTITVTDPNSGAAIARTVQVQGTWTGPVNTGITIFGVAATVIGNQFVSEPLQLAPGNTEITVRAKTLDGLSAEQTLTVAIGAAPTQDFVIALSSRIGFAPFRLKPRIAVQGITGVQSIAIDFNGDGANDYTGSVANIPIYTYSNPGIYRMRVVLNTAAQSFTRFRTLAVPGVPETRTRACAVFAHLRARLTANDSAGALKAIAQPLRGQMEPLFTELGANRPAFAARLGTIANGIFTPVNAELMLVNEVGTDLQGTPIHLTRGADGVWRIDSL
jgi:Glucodextranase, domain B